MSGFIAVTYSAKRFGIGEPGHGAAYLLQCVDTDTNDPIARRDAKVMAAGYDLLNALKLLAAAVPLDHPIDAKLAGVVRSAINKAEGI